jgi:hypothetical protein
VAGVLKEAARVAAVRAHPVKAIAEDQAALIRDQAAVEARGLVAAEAVYMVALVVRVALLLSPDQRLHARAGEAVAPTARAVRAAAE